MKICIRLDDITDGMDWTKFLRFKELMDRYGVKPLIGVVPECRDEKLAIDAPREDFWAYVRALSDDGWTIAMHGRYHVYTTRKGGLFPLNTQSEFAGIPYPEQERMIREGRAVLESRGISTDIFMAPAHSYDRNTVRALLSNGFTKMTDGFGTAPYTDGQMTWYPISFKKSASLAAKDGITTFVVHCNTLDEKNFEEYEKIFREQEMMPYSEYLKIPPVKRGAAGRAREWLMASAKRWMVKLR